MRYANDPVGLVARLDDLVGNDAGGRGSDFSPGSAIGQLNRVHTFTPVFLGGQVTDTPFGWVDLWTAPILIAGKPVGLATIWINPATDAPGSADVLQDPALAGAFADLTAGAALVHDD